MSMRFCPTCATIKPCESDRVGGTVCTSCGYVFEENSIVNDTTFMENSNGSSSAVGQFIPSTGVHSLFRGQPGAGVASREVTIQRARVRIRYLADSLQIPSRLVEQGVRVYQLALQCGFTKGRPAIQAVAACLYVVCRREKTAHMLMDFSEALQLDVFQLGNTFLQLCRKLSIQLPTVEPWLYVRRFAAQMEFGEKNHNVVSTACKLIASMKRDWILTGRRPAGVCAAALVVAARIHGFRRSVDDLGKTAKISGLTVNKRIQEFAKTTAADLTPEELDQQDEVYIQSCKRKEFNPPAFERARKKYKELEEKRKKKQEEGIEEESEIISTKSDVETIEDLMNLDRYKQLFGEKIMNENIIFAKEEENEDIVNEEKDDEEDSTLLEKNLLEEEDEKEISEEHKKEFKKLLGSKDTEMIDNAFEKAETSLKKKEGRKHVKKLTKKFLEENTKDEDIENEKETFTQPKQVPGKKKPFELNYGELDLRINSTDRFSNSIQQDPDEEEDEFETVGIPHIAGLDDLELSDDEDSEKKQDKTEEEVRENKQEDQLGEVVRERNLEEKIIDNEEDEENEGNKEDEQGAVGEDVADFSDIDDDEIEQYILRDKKLIQLKTKVWEEEFGEHVRKMEERRRQREQDKLFNMTAGNGRKRKRQTERQRNKVPAKSASEAAATMLRERRRVPNMDVENLFSMDSEMLGEDDFDLDREQLKKEIERDRQKKSGKSDNIFDIVSGMSKNNDYPYEEEDEEEDDEYMSVTLPSKKFKIF